MEAQTIKEDIGNTLKVHMPSGFTITIREQNGEDDDILSRGEDVSDTKPLHEFLAGITIENSMLDKGKFTTCNDVKLWKLKDKYYLALKSRLHSLGSEMEFDNTCGAKNCDHKEHYEEDLSKFDQDMSQPPKKEGDEGYFIGAITPYPNREAVHRTITLASKKTIRYKYLDGLGENKVLDMSKGQRTKNAELIARSIELKLSDSKWQKIENFKLFTAREMKEIRIDVKKNDSQFEMATDIKCPKCGAQERTPVIAFAGFFFPEDN